MISLTSIELNMFARVEAVVRKLPGMLFLLISFAPWIAYWALCGIDSRLGVALPLLISLILIIYQIRKKNSNLMDITSLFYFSTASIATFIFNSSIFVEENGFLSYLALFLMSVTSLVIEQPYTLQVSKRDYPEIYWRDKIFLTINKAITAFWAALFAANSLIFLTLRFPLTLMLSSALIAAGVAFSIIFPLKAPSYYALKDFKRYDWSVELDPRRPKGKDEYDVIIVGSGIGGLTCGALLSKRGYKVLVLEQYYQVGGYCSSFARMGFTFNAGVEDVSGLWERGPVSYLLNELGLNRDELFARNRVRFIFRGREIDADNLEGFIQTLTEIFPEERNNIYAFFDEAKKAYDECYRDLAYGAPLPAELIAKVFGPKKLLDYPKEHPHFYDWMNKTYMQKLSEFFTNEDLKTLLYALLGYLGTKADETPASSALTAAVAYYLYGGYFPKGGAQRFANTLRDFIERNGGKVLTKHRVDKILVEDGEVRGVKVGERVFRSPVVVANVNAKTVFLKLIDKQHLSTDFLEYIKNLRMSPSAFMVFLGVDMDLSSYPTIINNLDEGYSVVINSNADPELAPEGMASLTILTLASYRDFPERGTEEYLKKKRELAEALIKKVEKVIPDISSHIVVMDAATPKTFERYASMPEGAIYSFHQSINTRRPYFKTPIRGLYLASASTFPGGGIEAVVISGIICAHDICGWRLSTAK